MSAPQDDYVHGRKIIKAESLSQHRLQGREGLLRATEATEELFRAVGMKEPLPFTKPPAVPHTLEKKFEDGLAEYGVDANGPATNAKQRLSNIIEENNSEFPVQDTFLLPLTLNKKRIQCHLSIALVNK